MTLCVCTIMENVEQRLHWDKSGHNGFKSPAQTSVRQARGNWSRGQIQLCIYSAGSESGRVPILPLPPATHSLTLPSFTLLASATPCVSGQISPTVGSAGLCGGLFILERGLPSGSLHLSKHPSGRCSVFPASHTLHPLLLHHPLHPHPALSALSHTLFLFYHFFTAGFCHYSCVLSIFIFSSLCFPSLNGDLRHISEFLVCCFTKTRLSNTILQNHLALFK